MTDNMITLLKKEPGSANTLAAVQNLQRALANTKTAFQNTPEIYAPLLEAAELAERCFPALQISGRIVHVPHELFAYVSKQEIPDLKNREHVVTSIQNGGGLNSGQDFKFSNLATLTCFPEGFNPKGSVIIENCPTLTTLPLFTQARDVRITNCKAFTHLPEGFNPPGTVTILNCGSLERHYQWATKNRRSFNPIRSSNTRIIGYQYTISSLEI